MLGLSVFGQIGRDAGFPNMCFVLIPVKSLTRSKQRLAPLLSPDERSALAIAMFRDVLAAVGLAAGVDRVCVVSADGEALRLAAAAGAAGLAEAEQRSESASVDWGAGRCVQMGARSVLILPADLPLLSTADVAAVLSASNGGVGVVLVPSADERGSNAILRTPPDAIPSRFGLGSFERHQHEAAVRGIPCRILRLARVALDVDEVEHLGAVLATKASTHTHALLQELGVGERLSARLTP